ncbi:MAG: hypothetical protein IT529_02435 [Burkholderiales bacterium]|nr:hypothetical protein [Burkholderiales bacterium]
MSAALRGGGFEARLAGCLLRAWGSPGSAGAACLDVEPAMLAMALVNRYLDLKRASRL